MEEERVLKDHPDLAGERLEREIADVIPVQPNGAQLRVVEAREEASNRGLASAGGADQRRKLTGLDDEGNILDRRPIARAVTKGHLIALNLSTRLRQAERLQFLTDRDRQIHVLENALEEGE